MTYAQMTRTWQKVHRFIADFHCQVKLQEPVQLVNHDKPLDGWETLSVALNGSPLNREYIEGIGGKYGYPKRSLLSLPPFTTRE